MIFFTLWPRLAPIRMKHCLPHFIFFLLLALSGTGPVLAYGDVPVNGTPNHAVHYTVYVSKNNPAVADVEVELRGANEIRRMHFLLDKGRYRYFRGEGEIKPIGTDILWMPKKLNARLSYQVSLLHERKPGFYDSYGEKDWFITRTTDLFPRKRFDFKGPSKSYTTVKFKLPKDWTVVSEMPSIGLQSFRAVDSPDTRYQWPTGWLIFGKVGERQVPVEDVMIRFAYPEDFLRYGKPKYPEKRKNRIARFAKKLDDAAVLFQKVVPHMKKFLPKYAKDFLVVFGKSPMWRGGLSAEGSLFINRSTPVIVSDYSSTLIHEYFHICDGFKKDMRDAEWFVEGLAEYFSLRLLLAGKVISREQFFEGIESYRKFGLWNVNLTRSKNERVFYENAPLVLFTLDEMIRSKSRQQKSLKDVMRLLAEEDEPVGTALFRKKIEEIYGASLEEFFQNYVIEGRLPPYQKHAERFRLPQKQLSQLPFGVKFIVME